MNAQRPTVNSDLDSTSELPALDAFTYEADDEELLSRTDSWRGLLSPQSAVEERAAGAGPAARGPAESNRNDTIRMVFGEAERGRLEEARPGGEPNIETPAAPTDKAELERSLAGVSARLREAEERLSCKGERVVELERALDESRQLHRASIKRAESLTFEMGHVQAAEAAARKEALDLKAKLLEQERIQDRINQSVKGRDDMLLEQLVVRDRTIAVLQRDLGDAREQASRYLEATRTAEGRRMFFETLATDLHRRRKAPKADSEQAKFESELASLQKSLLVARTRAQEQEAVARKARERVDELEFALAGRARKIDQLESDLVALRAEHEQLTDKLRSRESEAHGSTSRLKELEGDLRAAEDAIHRLESELGNKVAKVDDLEKANEEWRVTAEEARNALTDRDSVIQRLEQDAANSSVLLGATQQQSVTRLDHSAVSEPAPDGATRLMIRADGESDIVHVLGRKTSIGRTPDNDLQIDANFISRHHAVVLAGPAHTIIEDLNSTNGVLVNGKRITRQALNDGDQVVIGKTLFRFAVRATSAERR